MNSREDLNLIDITLLAFSISTVKEYVLPTLYYLISSNRVTWCTSLLGLLNWIGRPDLDDEYIASFLNHGTGGSRTPYIGIQLVPPGRAIRICSRGVNSETFWMPPAERVTRFANASDYEERLRDLLCDSIRSRISGDGPIAAELSGGLDSSSILCLADQTLGLSREKLTTVSFHPDTGSRDDTFISCMERYRGRSGVHIPIEPDSFFHPACLLPSEPCFWQRRFETLRDVMYQIGSSTLLTGQLGDLIMGTGITIAIKPRTC